MWQRAIKTHIIPWPLNHLTGTVGSCNTQPREALNFSITMQQFGEGGGAGLVHRRAHGYLDGLQIPMARLAPPAAQHAQQLV